MISISELFAVHAYMYPNPQSVFILDSRASNESKTDSNPPSPCESEHSDQQSQRSASPIDPRKDPLESGYDSDDVTIIHDEPITPCTPSPTPSVYDQVELEQYGSPWDNFQALEDQTYRDYLSRKRQEEIKAAQNEEYKNLLVFPLKEDTSRKKYKKDHAREKVEAVVTYMGNRTFGEPKKLKEALSDSDKVHDPKDLKALPRWSKHTLPNWSKDVLKKAYRNSEEVLKNRKSNNPRSHKAHRVSKRVLSNVASAVHDKCVKQSQETPTNNSHRVRYPSDHPKPLRKQKHRIL